MSTTENMELDLPVVGITTGTEWATMLNEALEVIDEHDHTSGKGLPLSNSSITVSTNFDFNNKSIKNIATMRLNNQTVTPVSIDDRRAIYSKDGELAYLDSAGNEVILTSEGVINLRNSGGFGGDYGQTGNEATANFYNTGLGYYFYSDNGITYADVYVKKLTANDGATLLKASTITSSANVATLGITNTYSSSSDIANGITVTSVKGRAIQATSTDNYAIQATSTNSSGILATSTNSSGILATSTNSSGILGYSSTTSCYGVYGENSLNTGVGVTSTYGVYGKATSGHGVYGESTYNVGVAGLATGTGAYGGSFTSGTGSLAIGAKGLSASGRGLQGESTSGYGVYATSSTGTGVKGVATGLGGSGVIGYVIASCGVSSYAGYFSTLVPTGTSLKSVATEGIGVHGTATTGTGVKGVSTGDGGYGVLGYASSGNTTSLGGYFQNDITGGTALKASCTTDGGIGVHGVSTSGYAVYAEGASKVTGQLDVNNIVTTATSGVSVSSNSASVGFKSGFYTFFTGDHNPLSSYWNFSTILSDTAPEELCIVGHSYNSTGGVGTGWRFRKGSSATGLDNVFISPSISATIPSGSSLTIAIEGVSHTSSGVGVYGLLTSAQNVGKGVYGKSEYNDGSYEDTCFGVFGEAVSGYGIKGKSDFNHGVHGVSTYNYAVYSEGNCKITGQLELSNGSVSAPAYSFSSNLDCGMYYTTDKLNFAINATKYAELNSTGLIITGKLTATSCTLTDFVGVVKATAGVLSASEIVNADISSSAAIADTKLATISTTGKVSNSATTASSVNAASAIITRDSSGNFGFNRCVAADGSASEPSYSFSSDTDTGMYYTNKKIRFTIDSTNISNITNESSEFAYVNSTYISDYLSTASGINLKRASDGNSSMQSICSFGGTGSGDHLAITSRQDIVFVSNMNLQFRLISGKNISYVPFESSTTSYAIKGTSTTSSGILGYSSTTSCYGVYGENSLNTGAGVSSTYGVYGKATSGHGVYGETSYNVGVVGKGNEAGSYGGSFTSGSGTSAIGVKGTSASGYAVYAEGTSKVTGQLDVNNIVTTGGGVTPTHDGVTVSSGFNSTGFKSGFYTFFTGDHNPLGSYWKFSTILSDTNLEELCIVGHSYNSNGGTGTGWRFRKGSSATGLDNVFISPSISATIPSGSSLTIAIEGTASTGSGVKGNASTGNGVEGTSTAGTGVKGNDTTSGKGVHGTSSSGFGVHGFSSSNYGVYGGSGTSYGVVAATGTGTYSLYVNGAAYCTSGSWTASDRRLKKDITNINSKEALEIILKLEPVNFTYIKHDKHRRAGFIAQDYMKYLPDQVTPSGEPLPEYDSKGNLIKDDVLNIDETKEKGLALSEQLTPYLTSAIQEQQRIIDNLLAITKDQQQQIDELKQLIKGV